MTEKGFDYDGFFLPISREFFPKDGLKPGQGVQLELNLDLLTLEYLERLEKEFNDITDESFGLLRYVHGDDEASIEDTAAAADVPADTDAATSTQDAALALVTDQPEKAPKRKEPEIPKLEIFIMEKARFRFWARALTGLDGETRPDQRLVRSWDVTRKGKPVPISYETFLAMPYSGLQKLYKFVIGEANNPTPQEKKRSDDI